jgi:hypothetical protein
MENYQIVLSPDLGLSAADFVAAWNEDAEARNQAEAHLVPSTSEHYDPTLLVTILLAVATGTASNVLSEFIIRVVEKKKESHKHTHVEETKKPDGTRLLVVDIDE